MDFIENEEDVLAERSVASVASSAAVQRAHLSRNVDRIVTHGFHRPLDGGGAVFERTDREPRHEGKVQSGDGAWWEIVGPILNVRQFGARGDGATDESASIQAALDCPRASTLEFPPGSYRAIELRLGRSCRITGRDAELFWDDAAVDGDLLYIFAGKVRLEGLRFRGLCYEDLTTVITPNCLVKIDTQTEPADEGYQLLDLSFVGGRQGLVIAISTDVHIERPIFKHCRDYGLVLMKGPRNIIIRGLIARQIGRYGGLKLNYNDSQRATERVVMSDFVVEDSGKLDPNDWQEGLDLACGFAREMVICNGVISGCANGGIEFKTGGRIVADDEEYSDIIVSNVSIRMLHEAHGIVFNWTGPKTNSEKIGQRIIISDCILRHDKGARSSASTGIEISAWSNIMVQNSYIHGARVGIRIAPDGAASDRADNIVIAGNRLAEVEFGFRAAKGTIGSIEISHNSIASTRYGVCLEGSHVERAVVHGNTIEQKGEHEGWCAAIYALDCEDIDIFNNVVMSDGHGVILQQRRTSTTGRVGRNNIRSRKAAFRITGGAWTICDNHVWCGAYATIDADDEARVRAAWNIRDVDHSAGGRKGADGDVILRAGHTALLPLGWQWRDGPEGADWAAFGHVRDLSDPND